MRLLVCAGLSEPSLLTDKISTKFQCTGPYIDGIKGKIMKFYLTFLLFISYHILSNFARPWDYQHSFMLNSTVFIQLINVKMPTIVGILTFNSRIDTVYESLKQEKYLYFNILVFISRSNLMLS